MRRLLLVLGALLAITAGSAGAGRLWYAARAAGQWPILVQQADGNLRLVNQQGQGRQLTTDADGQQLSYLYSAPAPDGQSVATVAIRNNPQNPSTVLMVHSLDGRRATLFDDPDHSPFYLSWSPDSRKVAFLASSGMGMTLHAVAANGEEQAKEIAPGGPSYFAWSSDSERLLMHIGGGTPLDSLLVYQWGAEKPEIIDAKLAYFNTPTWLSNDQQALVALQQDGDAALAAIDTQGKVVQQLVKLKTGTLFIPSPDAKQIAYVSLAEGSIGHLHVVDVDGKNDRTISRIPTLTFFWSPQGDKLAFLTVAQDVQAISTRQQFPSVRWNVLTLADGKLAAYEPFVPSAAFTSLLPYFDQYAQSIRLWDRTGSQLLYASDEGVHVIDVVNQRTQRVSDGVLGMWMER